MRAGRGDASAPPLIDWSGGGWQPLKPGSPFDRQLATELAPQHPLTPASPRPLGRCLSCDDIVVALTTAAGEPELAVVHLTWEPRRPPSGADQAWPYFERLTAKEFVARFVRGGEHL